MRQISGAQTFGGQRESSAYEYETQDAAPLAYTHVTQRTKDTPCKQELAVKEPYSGVGIYQGDTKRRPALFYGRRKTKCMNDLMQREKAAASV